MNIAYNQSLLGFNTFHIDEMASEVSIIEDEQQLFECLQYINKNQKPLFIIGGGSNILLTHRVEGLTIVNKIKGIEVIQETDEFVDIKSMSGENWHACVRWCVEKNYGGLENLSLIPGTVGAAPIQNIGAYGVELQEVCLSVEAIHIHTLQKRIFQHHECAFGYRDSVFKQQEKGNYFILSVTMRLQKNPTFNIAYGDIQKILALDFNNILSIKNISDAIIKIRKSKLPNPDEIGNAGSFFKNPVIANAQAESLKNQYPNMPMYAFATETKIPAAWLIEQCGWKGYRQGNYGVHTLQALVLVNYANAHGHDIVDLSTSIITSVQQRFNIQLEREVNIW